MNLRALLGSLDLIILVDKVWRFNLPPNHRAQRGLDVDPILVKFLVGRDAVYPWHCLGWNAKGHECMTFQKNVNPGEVN